MRKLRQQDRARRVVLSSSNRGLLGRIKSLLGRIKSFQLEADTLGIVALGLLLAMSILSLAFPFLDNTFWLPRERLVFKEESASKEEPAFTGYVLKTSEDYLTILKDKPRVIIERKKDTLKDRDYCYPKSTDENPVSENVQANMPSCP